MSWERAGELAHGVALPPAGREVPSAAATGLTLAGALRAGTARRGRPLAPAPLVLLAG
ncbi:hypothetical protein [Streptomyces sp. NPDC059564]|uniref:hypothetical protein n=1 Tax=Streptomyces sp. NPDC059564 TaxID=3346865 RepID=UPI0036A99CF1